MGARAGPPLGKGETMRRRGAFPRGDPPADLGPARRGPARAPALGFAGPRGRYANGRGARTTGRRARVTERGVDQLRVESRSCPGVSPRIVHIADGAHPPAADMRLYVRGRDRIGNAFWKVPRREKSLAARTSGATRGADRRTPPAGRLRRRWLN